MTTEHQFEQSAKSPKPSLRTMRSNPFQHSVSFIKQDAYITLSRIFSELLRRTRNDVRRALYWNSSYSATRRFVDNSMSIYPVGEGLQTVIGSKEKQPIPEFRFYH